MRPIVTDQVAWSVGLSVCQSVRLVSPAKRLNRSRCRLGSGLWWAREPCIRCGPDPHGKGQFFRRKGRPILPSHCKVLGHSTVICAKTAEPIEMPFGLWAWMCPRNYVVDGSTGAMASNFWLRYYTDVAQWGSTTLCTMFGRLLSLHNIVA